MALADTAQLAVKLTLDDRGFTGPLGRVQKQIGGLGKNFGRVGKGFGQVGAGLARVGYIAAGVAAGGLVAVARASVNWESALAGVNKTMDLTPEQLQSIGNEIRVLATRIPLGADAIAGLVEQAGALGIARQDVVRFAETAATIGVTTDVAADQAATSLGVMSNLLGLVGDDYERFASALVDLGNKGASTEAQILAIAERAAGAGATIGLSAEQILGFSSAVANIGIEPEAGGSSLQKFFIETLKMTRQGGKELETFAKVTGTTTDEFAKLFKQNPEEALGGFIDGLSELSKGQRLDVLENLGFSDIRITRMLLGLAQAEENNDNLTKSLNVSAEAWASNTAAAEEADKRYGTVASKLTLLKNQAIESALLIGEGFLPALGRMADKLKSILADPEQRKTLTDFGKDIGAIIDGIDFNKVIGGAKTFLGVAKTIWAIMSKIPVEIHAAVIALGGLNSLSGGLLGAGVGNIFGGISESIGRSLFAKIPGIGKLGAMPVYVTNWGGMPGGGGGAVAGGGLKGFLGNALKFAGLALIPAILAEVQSKIIQPGLDREAGENISDVQRVIGTGDPAQIRAALEGIRAGIANLDPLQKILYDLNANGVKTHTESLVEALKAALLGAEPNRQPLPDDISPKQAAKFDALRDKAEANRIALVTVSREEQAKITALKIGQTAMKAALAAKLAATIAAGHNDATRIIGAIRAARPIVNVSVVASTYTTNTTVRSGGTVKRSTGQSVRRDLPITD